MYSVKGKLFNKEKGVVVVSVGVIQTSCLFGLLGEESKMIVAGAEFGFDCIDSIQVVFEMTVAIEIVCQLPIEGRTTITMIVVNDELRKLKKK